VLLIWYPHVGASTFTAAAGLYPTEDLEAAKCDAIMDSAVDYRTVLLPSYMEQDEVKKVSVSKWDELIEQEATAINYV